LIVETVETVPFEFAVVVEIVFDIKILLIFVKPFVHGDHPIEIFVLVEYFIKVIASQNPPVVANFQKSLHFFKYVFGCNLFVLFVERSALDSVESVVHHVHLVGFWLNKILLGCKLVDAFHDLIKVLSEAYCDARFS